MGDRPPGMLGVLGGMGPLATVDFLRKLLEETPAERDADHVPVVVYSVPQIPDRPAAILGEGPSPVPAMAAGIRVLTRAGATRIAIACNTAHYWFDELAREAGVPLLHIAVAACDELAQRGVNATAVGVIGTRGTITAGFYQERLAARGIRALLSSEVDLTEFVLPAIAAVKRGDLPRAHELAVRACEQLRAAGAQSIILACTELPPALDLHPTEVATICVDATRALARACVRWWLESSGADRRP